MVVRKWENMFTENGRQVRGSISCLDGPYTMIAHKQRVSSTSLRDSPSFMAYLLKCKEHGPYHIFI